MRKILLLLLFLAVVPAVISVGVSPPSVEYIFEPGMSGNADFYFRNNLEKDMTLLASLNGDLAQYAEITSEKAMYLKPQEKGYVHLTFSMPDYIGEPGWHNFDVVATEAEGTGGTVGARGQVVVPVKFFVQYPGKKLSIRLDAVDSGLGQKVPLKLYISNVGTEAVSRAVPKVEIFKDGEKKGEVTGEAISIDVLENQVVELSWDSAGAGEGVYSANATLSYEEGEAFSGDDFRIGTFDLDVTGFTKSVGEGTINKFYIELESKWNENIENIFADINVIKNESIATTFSAAESLLKPWQRKNISGFLDATGLDPGVYDIEINLKFSSNGETKEKTVTGQIEVLKKKVFEEKVKEEEAGSTETKKTGIFLSGYLTTTNILILLVVLLVIINIVILLRRKRKNDKEYQEGDSDI